MQPMRFILLLLFCMAGCRTSNSGGAAGDAAGTAQPPAGSGFDFYLLNLSWSPEYCYSHPSGAECGAHAGFVLHGLWPQNNDGSYPENCSNAPGPSDAGQYRDLYPEPGLLMHEWRAHGTCSGLSADAFFATARRAYEGIKIPAALAQLQQTTAMPPEEILEQFTAANPGLGRESLALSCGRNYLTAVEVCLDKRLHPVACARVRSCGARTVRVLPPS